MFDKSEYTFIIIRIILFFLLIIGINVSFFVAFKSLHFLEKRIILDNNLHDNSISNLLEQLDKHNKTDIERAIIQKSLNEGIEKDIHEIIDQQKSIKIIVEKINNEHKKIINKH